MTQSVGDVWQAKRLIKDGNDRFEQGIEAARRAFATPNVWPTSKQMHFIVRLNVNQSIRRQKRERAVAAYDHNVRHIKRIGGTLDEEMGHDLFGFVT